MRMGAPLNFRYQEILNSIVRAYIETGEPVSSRTIAKLRHNALSPASIPELAQELDQIQLVPLSDRRVLMVLVTMDHMVRNRIIMLDEVSSPEELLSICNYVNRNFHGWQLGQARRELLRRLAEEREL